MQLRKNMHLLFTLFFLLFGVVVPNDLPTCPDGSEIYALGIDDDQIVTILFETNQIRQMILNGEVPDQPQGIEIPDLEWDDQLSNDSQVVPLSCKFEHIIKNDDRFKVGQNLYITWSSNKKISPDWPRAVRSWYEEYIDFVYPDTNDKTLHYSQLIWANTTLVGCTFIAYYDSCHNYPYARLYSCNYGPCGNIVGEAPYRLA